MTITGGSSLPKGDITTAWCARPKEHAAEDERRGEADARNRLSGPSARRRSCSGREPTRSLRRPRGRQKDVDAVREALKGDDIRP